MRLGVLLRKEFLESWRTYRAIVLLAVFVLFGILSPVGARYLPELLKTMDMQGMVIQIPPPTIADANVQFVKNMSQIGTIVMILVAMGVVARERDKGTVAFTLSKPASRGAFLLAKFLALAVIVWASLAVAALAHLFYTGLLLGPLSFRACAVMTTLVGLYLTTILALAFLGSTVTKSLAVAAAVGFGGYLALSLAGGLPRVGKFMPGDLLGRALAAGNGAAQAGWGSALVSLWLIVACLALAWAVFRKAEL